MNVDDVREIDVGVIGGGPAGLAAATAARKEGAEHVVVFERDMEPGGILQQCIHPGFGLHMFKEELTGPEYAERYIRQSEEAGVEFNLNTIVFSMDVNESLNGRKYASLWVMSPKRGVENIIAKSVVLAMGCRERPAGAHAIPGTRPSGIYTAGTAQRFVNIEGFMPGKKVAIRGTGDIGLIMARRMALEGAEVVGAFGAMPWPAGLKRNVAQCLYDFGIPCYLGYNVCELHGKDRLEGISVVQVDRNRRPIDGTMRFVECDTLLLAVGLIPENELTRMAGIVIDSYTGGPTVNEFLQTSKECVFAAGNVVVVYDVVDFVSQEGVLAGKSAALYAAGKLKKGTRRFTVEAGHNVRGISPCELTGGQDARLFLRVAEPVEQSCRLYVEPEIYSQKLRYARPSEMNEVRVSAEKLNALPPEVTIIKVGLEINRTR